MKLRALAWVGLGLAFAATAVAGEEPSRTREEFCEKAQDFGYFKTLIAERRNQLSFTNPPIGIANGGICWWHSRMTRYATYLGVYKPELPRPTEAQAKKIIKAFTKGEKLGKPNVVEVPGYHNFHEFSRDWEEQIQKRLEEWQVNEGVWGADWLTRGLHGSTKVSAAKLKKTMDELYELVEEKKEITYQMLQMPGVVAHAWLVVNMAKVPNGYDLEVVDSNFYGTRVHKYREGMENFGYANGAAFVPYTDRLKEVKNVRKAIDNYCKNGTVEKLPEAKPASNRRDSSYGD